MNEPITHLDGILVGLLSPEELRMFERAVRNGEAQRDYSHAGGLLGLAKVKVIHAPTAPTAPTAHT